MVFIIEEKKFGVKLRAYSVFKVDGIILPTDLKGDLLKEIGIAISVAFRSASLKVALSSLQFNIIELVLVA